VNILSSVESAGMKETPHLERVPAHALDTVVMGVGLSPGTLRDQLDERVTLLVFLRHFGCIFCREMVSGLRLASEANPNYPRVLFFTQSKATEGRAFLRRYWPGASAIADPKLELYDLFGVGRAGLLQALGPSVIAARSRARRKGMANGPRSGDIWRMPGLFAVQQESVIWTYHPKHAADHPDFDRIPELIDL
jgi:hypothetical protein